MLVPDRGKGKGLAWISESLLQGTMSADRHPDRPARLASCAGWGQLCSGSGQAPDDAAHADAYAMKTDGFQVLVKLGLGDSSPVICLCSKH